VRARTRITCVADHEPPRAVGMLRSFNPSAMACNDRAARFNSEIIKVNRSPLAACFTSASLRFCLLVARLTNYRSILLSTSANFLRGNYPTAYRSPLRIGRSRRRLPELRRSCRHRHSLGYFGPRNKRGRRRSALLRPRNRSSRGGCRSPHSTSRHKATCRPDAQHSTECK
jgi:hypothetical protein